MKSKYFSFEWFNLKIFLQFASGNIFFQLIAIACDLIILKLVPVEEIGYWQIGMLIQGYVVVSRLGIINSFNREYPYLLGEKKDSDVRKILETTLFHTFWGAIFQSLIFLSIASYFLFIGKTFDLILSMIAMSIYTIFDSYSNLLEAKLRGDLKFKKISILKFYLSFVYLGSLLLPLFLHFEGLLLRLIVIQVTQFIFLYYFTNFDCKLKFSKSHWLIMFKDGWKFWLWSYLKTFSKSLPRLFLITFSTAAMVGYFTPINWFLSASTLITSSLSNYLYPILSSKISSEKGGLGIETLKINLLTFFIGIPFVFCGLYILPYFVRVILPEYQAIIFPMKLTLIASLFEIVSVSAIIWASEKNWTKMFSIIFLSILVNLCSFFWILSYPDNLLINLGYAILFNAIVIAIITIILILIESNKSEKKATILFI